jgi:ribose transport system ATP-binding protein
VLEVRNLTWAPIGSRTSRSTVRAGEVVGLGGLDGQGQRELLLALFGVLRGCTGEVLIDGKPAAINSPPRAAKARGSDRHGADPRGPQDRGPDAADVGARQSELCRPRPGVARRHRRPPAEKPAIDEVIKLLAIKTAGSTVPVGSLSGGNQQKVVIAKWLMRNPRIILLNDPDARHRRRHQAGDLPAAARLADEGAAILFYSTDYDELIGCCDRVLVSTTARSSASWSATRSPSMR